MSECLFMMRGRYLRDVLTGFPLEPNFKQFNLIFFSHQQQLAIMRLMLSIYETYSVTNWVSI